MSKKALILLMFGSCFAVSVHALPFQQLFQKQIKSHLPATHHQPTVNQDDVYADFSGTWEGHCGNDTDQDEEDHTTKISNTASDITIDGTSYHIGALNGGPNADDANVFDYTVFNWDEQKTALTMDLFHGAMIYIMPGSALNGLLVSAGNFSIGLENGQLLISINNLLFINHAEAAEVPEVRATCLLHKVSDD